jgi:2'-5' RNA ligase
MIRAFIALDLPDDVLDLLEITQDQLRLPRPILRENLHITLCFLGDIPLPLAEDVHHELAALALPELDLRLSGLGMFGGSPARSIHANVAPDPALTRMAAKVTQAARMAGATPERRRFVPHVTLARLTAGQTDQARLERAVADQSRFAAGPFRVRDFVLYRSFRDRDGARYEDLARYPLIPAP